MLTSTRYYSIHGNVQDGWDLVLYSLDKDGHVATHQDEAVYVPTLKELFTKILDMEQKAA